MRGSSGCGRYSTATCPMRVTMGLAVRRARSARAASRSSRSLPGSRTLMSSWCSRASAVAATTASVRPALPIRITGLRGCARPFRCRRCFSLSCICGAFYPAALPTLAPVNATDPMEPELAEVLREAARIRASGALGRSLQMQRLFDFLVACRTTGRVPKEIEVAIDCFERQPGTEAAQDATVRVTAHKLRRRLEEFYRDAGEAPRLTIPRGEYRLALGTPPSAAPPAGPGWRHWLPATRREGIAAAVAGLALAVALAALLLRPTPAGRAERPMAEVRQSTLWAPILEDALPVQ